MQESDPEKKQALYCHCPNVQEAHKMSAAFPVSYCYCGAGFYKGIWEEIMQKPVKVELISSILTGDSLCRFKIHLPQSIH